MNIDLLRKELELDEGRRHVPYRDTEGNWTCGIGHLLNREPRPKEYWSDKTIESVFKDDVLRVLKDISHRPWFLALETDGQQRALANMVFNLGVHGVEGFHTFLRLLESHEYKKAGEDLRHTKWHREVPARADRIIKLISG